LSTEQPISLTEQYFMHGVSVPLHTSVEHTPPPVQSRCSLHVAPAFVPPAQRMQFLALSLEHV
jgi:hypothetical protein